MLYFRWIFPTLISLLLTACSSPGTDQAAAPTVVRVAAASDLRYAMDSLVRVYARQQPDVRVEVTYGSSGKFYEQIRRGAPFEVLFSADSNYPTRLQADGLTAAPPVLYATGRLVLWSKKLDPATQGIRSLLDPRIQKIAIANPAHAPYGERAAEALRYYTLYDQVKPRLVLGENIAQTANFAASGAADAGILALSLALSPELQSRGRYWLIPQAAYSPLTQSFVVLKGNGPHPAATRFAGFMASEPARAVLRTYGFTLPD